MEEQPEKSRSSFPAISCLSGKSCQLSSPFREASFGAFIKDIRQGFTRSSNSLHAAVISTKVYLYTIER